MTYVLVCLASLASGFVDAIVGGGGLILVPTLLGVFPNTPVATLYGTNKAAAVWGTGLALRRYARRVDIQWTLFGPAVATAAAGSFGGAWLATRVSSNDMRRAVPLLLTVVLVYTLARKDLGQTHSPRPHLAGVGALLGLIVGCYDGFFGPGTGSFFVFGLVRFAGFDFLHASAVAKLLNVATNLAALTLFVSTGHVWWRFAIPMAVANVVGSFAGSTVALRRGSRFVRVFFVVVVTLLIIRTASVTF